MTGNFDPEHFTLEDLSQAVATTHKLPEPAAPRMSVDLINQVVAILKEANPQRAENPQFGSAVAWGIAIGVLAERNRVARNS